MTQAPVAIKAGGAHVSAGPLVSHLRREMEVMGRGDGCPRSELFVHQEFGNRDPAFSGDGIEQIHSPVFFKDGGIAQLIYLSLGGTAHRWNERCVRTLPATLRP
jgi:hypothetical protein